MRKILFVILAVGFLPYIEAQETNKTYELFQSILDAAVAENEITGVSMAVLAPNSGISWTGAAGYDSREKNVLLRPSQPFRVASITKTFVAAAILRLQEEGKLKIDDPISGYISKEHQEMLRKDGYDPGSITIKHCLQHRSGLYDYAQGSSAFIEAALQDPKKRWTRTEQIQFALQEGDPYGDPGEVYAYSDTGYIVLGEIIEVASKKNLAIALRELLKYDAIGLKATWLESLEQRPPELSDPVHRYFQDIDATAWDNSIDLYGGGGISSTTSDLAQFINALFTNTIYEEDNSLTTMLEKPKQIAKRLGSSDYRMGLWKRNVGGIPAFSHNGFWGTVWVFIPDHQCTIVINYTNFIGWTGILTKTAKLIQDTSDKK